MRGLKEYYGDLLSKYEEQIEDKDKEIKRLKNNWNKLKDFINRNCFYDEDTLSYEELSTEIGLIEYGSENNE